MLRILRVNKMTTISRKTKPKTPRQRMQARRARLRAQGLRPVQYWVPDLRDPRARADLRRQGRLLAQHAENAAIDAWIEAIYDPSGWCPDSEVRTHWRHTLMRTSESKGH